MPHRSQTPDEAAESRRLTDFLLSDVIGISADAIICVDAKQRITFFNDGAAKIFGWTADEVMGQPLNILLPERAREVHGGHVEHFRDAPERSRKMGERTEISGVRKNGQEFPAEAAIAKVKMGDSVVYSVVLRDITEQMQLHKRLQEAVKARDDTVGVVAHDLRNPVSAVKMLAHALLTSDSPPRDDVREQIELIHDAAGQMDRLIQDLLDVTRAQTGRLYVNLEPVTTRALLEGALGTLRPLIEGARLDLVEDVPAVLPHVLADAERVGQVLSNLIGNAIKATAAGGRITVRAAATDGFVEISVGDSGVGISPADLPHIFDRFWQADTPGTRLRGAGLGLPIARGIVQAHGGKISAESLGGSGTTIRFTLPIASAS
jgi:PAS domain S-box-containing protein